MTGLGYNASGPKLNYNKYQTWNRFVHFLVRGKGFMKNGIINKSTRALSILGPRPSQVWAGSQFVLWANVGKRQFQFDQSGLIVWARSSGGHFATRFSLTWCHTMWHQGDVTWTSGCSFDPLLLFFLQSVTLHDRHGVSNLSLLNIFFTQTIRKTKQSHYHNRL